MAGRRTIGSAVLAAVLMGMAAERAEGQEPAKPAHLLSHAHKSGFSAEDRDVVARYLAEHGYELPVAPSSAEAELQSGLWPDELERFSRPLPRRLERALAPAATGTRRIVFNGTILVVRTSDGQILDRVYPAT